jgi:hypothetical protein
MRKTRIRVRENEVVVVQSPRLFHLLIEPGARGQALA